MDFCFDDEYEGLIWVDRGSDDRADRFRPCTPCFDNLRAADMEGRVWSELNLCPNCQMALMGELFENDFFGFTRPIITDPDHTPVKAFDDIEWNLPEPLWKKYFPEDRQE